MLARSVTDLCVNSGTSAFIRVYNEHNLAGY